MKAQLHSLNLPLKYHFYSVISVYLIIGTKQIFAMNDCLISSEQAVLLSNRN